MTGRWFPQYTPVSSIMRTDRQNIWNIVESGAKHHYQNRNRIHTGTHLKKGARGRSYFNQDWSSIIQDLQWQCTCIVQHLLGSMGYHSLAWITLNDVIRDCDSVHQTLFNLNIFKNALSVSEYFFSSTCICFS